MDAEHADTRYNHLGISVDVGAASSRDNRGKMPLPQLRSLSYYGEHKILDMSLRGAQRRSNLNSIRSRRLLRFARNDNVLKRKE